MLDFSHLAFRLRKAVLKTYNGNYAMLATTDVVRAASGLLKIIHIYPIKFYCVIEKYLDQ